jgi:hypothetical protein
MAINAGRHPILETLHTDFVVSYFFLLISTYLLRNHFIMIILLIKMSTAYVLFFIQPNNTFLSEASNMVLVMGPNM